MHRIVRLPENVINQIAAGEVIEQPSSIVKECIENSLDANAKWIQILIAKGGQQLIRIEDDGCGMHREDALLSIERHATSKIRTEQDLTSLMTMGFRGEALAAIAAVSQFDLRTSDGEAGTWIASEGGRILSVQPCARNRGTTVEIKSLFFNMPARKKFLKSAVANTAQIVRTVETLALAHPEVSFRLISEDRTLLNVFPEEKVKRIEQLLGPMPYELQSEHLWGMIGSVQEVKKHRRQQYVFINRRPVVSPLISKAVQLGYGTRIAEGSHPPFILFLHLAPDAVDVNVHPQKREVRFSDEKHVFHLVEQAVSSAFDVAPAFTEQLLFKKPAFSAADPHSWSYVEERAPSLIAEQHLFSDLVASRPAERPLAVVDQYFLLQREGELLLVNLQAAYGRILYESLKEKTGEMQTLLWPVEVMIEDESIVEELQALRIECRLIGNRRLAIDAIPSLLHADDFAQFVMAWEEGKKMDQATVRYTKAMKKRFNFDEACLLWSQLLKCTESKFDPEGKRIWKSLHSHQLQKILEGA